MTIENALALAAANRERSTAVLAELVRIPSLTGEEGKAQNYIGNRLAEIGIEAETAEPDVAALFERYPDIAQYPTHWQKDLILPYETLPTYAALRDSGLLDVLNYRGRPNVVGVVRGTGGGRSLILNGHMDTVTIEPRTEWTKPPFGALIEGDLMYGRGTSDMKGGLAAGLMALTYLHEAGVRLAGDIIFQSVVNEEHAGNGTLDVVRRGCSADAAIVLEPTDNTVLTSSAGGLYWQIMVPGLARSPGARWEGGHQVGVSAVEKLPVVLRALLTLEETFNLPATGTGYATQKPFSLVIGKIAGGHYETVTAEVVTIRGSAYFAPSVGEVGLVMAAFRSAVQHANETDPFLRAHPARLTFLHHDDATRQDPNIGIAREALDLITRRGGGGAGRDMSFCCDVRHLVNQGNIPSIIFGPGMISQAHRPDEHISIASYTASVEHLIALIGAWCDQEPPNRPNTSNF